MLSNTLVRLNCPESSCLCVNEMLDRVRQRREEQSPSFQRHEYKIGKGKRIRLDRKIPDNLFIWNRGRRDLLIIIYLLLVWSVSNPSERTTLFSRAGLSQEQSSSGDDSRLFRALFSGSRRGRGPQGFTGINLHHLRYRKNMRPPVFHPPVSDPAAHDGDCVDS